MEPKNLTAAEAVAGIVNNAINDEKRGQAFRVHMEELVKNDYVSIDLTIGEWHWSLVAKASHLPELKSLIIDSMKEGFQVSHDEEKYEASKGSFAGYR